MFTICNINQTKGKLWVAFVREYFFVQVFDTVMYNMTNKNFILTLAIRGCYEQHLVFFNGFKYMLEEKKPEYTESFEKQCLLNLKTNS